METALRTANIPDDGGILVEYNIPATSKRIDVIVSGYDDQTLEAFQNFNES